MYGEWEMTSEWEKLEELTKDELIIELVKARRAMRNMCSLLHEISDDGASHYLYDAGEKPSDEWLSKIVNYAKSELEPGDELDGSDLERYGVDGRTAERCCYGPDWRSS